MPPDPDGLADAEHLSKQQAVAQNRGDMSRRSRGAPGAIGQNVGLPRIVVAGDVGFLGDDVIVRDCAA